MSSGTGRTRACFLAPRPGDEVQLSLRSELENELALLPAATRVRELRARGIDRVRVRVVKVPQAGMLAADDAVKVNAPELTGDGNDSGVYVSLAFLDIPTVPADNAGHDADLPRRVESLGLPVTVVTPDQERLQDNVTTGAGGMGIG